MKAVILVGGEGTRLRGIKTHIGSQASLQNGIAARGCVVNSCCQVIEGCVLGDKVTLGENSRLEQGVEVWPDKHLQPGDCLSGC